MLEGLAEFAPVKVTMLSIVTPYCDLRHAIGACTATRNDGSECYNTITTCQSLADYTTTTGNKIRFTPYDGPIIHGLNAFRTLKDVQYVNGSIDPSGGLGGRDQVVGSLVDHVDEDIATDKYHKNRPSIQGTFWTKFLARNRSYQGGQLFIEDGVVDENGYLDLDNLDSREYVLESISSKKNGTIAITGRDLLKKLDTALFPAPTDAEIVADIPSSGSDPFSLKSGHSLTDGNYILRINDEFIQGSLSGDDFSVSSRAYAGTTIAAHKADDRVQEVAHIGGTVDYVWSYLLQFAGIDSSKIDEAGAADEIADWVTIVPEAYLSKPTKVSDLIRDLLEQTSCMTWWEPIQQIVRLRAIHPRVPGQSAYVITDEIDIIADTTEVDPLESDRITRLAIYYGVKDWSKDFSKQDNEAPAFTRVQQYIDADAENELVYGDIRPKVIYAYWIPYTAQAQVRAAAFRIVKYLRDAPRKITISVTDRTAYQMVLGDQVDLTTDEVVDVDGSPKKTECIITGERPPKNGSSEWFIVLAPTELEGQWIFFASNTAPDFSAATDEEKQYWYFSDSNGLNPDGTPGATFV